MQRQAALTKSSCSLKEISEKQLHQQQPSNCETVTVEMIHKHKNIFSSLHAISLPQEFEVTVGKIKCQKLLMTNEEAKQNCVPCRELEEDDEA